MLKLKEIARQHPANDTLHIVYTLYIDMILKKYPLFGKNLVIRYQDKLLVIIDKRSFWKKIFEMEGGIIHPAKAMIIDQRIMISDSDKWPLIIQWLVINDYWSAVNDLAFKWKEKNKKTGGQIERQLEQVQGHADEVGGQNQREADAEHTGPELADEAVGGPQCANPVDGQHKDGHRRGHRVADAGQTEPVQRVRRVQTVAMGLTHSRWPLPPRRLVHHVSTTTTYVYVYVYVYTIHNTWS